MSGEDITTLTLSDLAEALRARRVSSLEATRACLAAVERWQPRINCFISVEADEALAQAASADREIAQGRWRGALHGVPLAHKDMFYRAGRISTCGSRIYARKAAAVTAAVQERLANAGAIYLGGLNMSEFAAGPTGHNEHYGHCRNPWDPRRVTGGSSSGSGAAVAARVVFGSLGSDTGGSVRLPAAMCGVTGVKPTYGLVSRYGIMPRCWSLDVVGPLARTARDCAMLLQAVAGPDARDPTCAPFAPPDYLGYLNGGAAGLKIGVPENPLFAEVAPEVQEALETSRGVLRELGAKIVSVVLPDIRLLYDLTNLVNKAEAAAVHGAWVRARRDEYSLSAINRFEAGFHVPATHYLDAIRVQGRIVRDFVERVFSQVDLLHLPVLGIETPTIEETEIRSTEGVPALMERITRFTRWLSYLGLPAVSVPCGFTPRKLPLAFQLIGRPFAEKTLLRAADAYQCATAWHRAAPPLPAPE